MAFLVYLLTLLAIRVSPQTIFAGGSISVTCKVALDKRNRVLQYGITGYTQSTRDLDGVNDRITYGPYEFKHVMEEGEAFCRVMRNDGTMTEVKGRFQIAE